MQLAWLLLLLPLSLASFIDDNSDFDDVLTDTVIERTTPEQIEHFLKQARESGVGYCPSTKRKSPIDIDLGNVTLVSLPPLNFKNYATSEIVMEKQNNFSMIIHGYQNWTAQPIISGGPLQGEYKLVEVQWSANDLGNSFVFDYYGHTVNSAKQDLELQFIHTKNGVPVDEALRIPGGIAIVALFITEVLPTIYDKRLTNNKSLDLPEKPGVHFKWISPETFLPDELDSYYTYDGTLARPPCTGDVTWIILSNPTAMTQLDLFSYLHFKRFHRNINNYISKRRSHPNVLFNRPDVASLSQTTSFSVFWAVFFFILGLVVGLLFFFRKTFTTKIAQQQQEDNHTLVNHQIGFDNPNSLS